MRHRGILLFVATGALAMAQTPPLKPSWVVDRAYQVDGLALEGIGVCSILPNEVDCWDMDGKRDPSLSEKVRLFFISQNRDINLKFGKKNRWLVLRRPHSWNLSQIQDIGGGYLSSEQVGYAQNEPVTTLVRYPTDEATKTASVHVAISGLDEVQKASIPLRQGAKATVGDAQIEIGKYQKVVEAPPYIYAGYGYGWSYPYGTSVLPTRNEGFTNWSIILGVSTADQQNRAVQFRLLGKDGRPLLYTDKKGKPVSSVIVLNSAPPGTDPNMAMPNREYAPAVLAPSQPSVEGATTYYTNVDPQYIGSIEATRSMQRRVQINGFPLDPR